ncbi:MAG: DUF839 domain-containing protein [Pseudomonas sp.]|nr:MAG: DUF839 domain-containing protein [Pseudomonas sp.]
MNPSGIASSCAGRAPWLSWAALAVALTLAGCGGGNDSRTVLADTPSQAVPVQVPPAQVSPVQTTVSSHKLGGSISGLTGAGLVIANGSDTQSISVKSTSFIMPTQVQTGTAYSLTVFSQPTGQYCSFANAVGTMPDADMRNTVLTCASTAFPVGGSISGLSASGLILANGSDIVTVAQGAVNFTFATAVATGSDWEVAVRTQPAGQICTVSKGRGQVGDAAVNIAQVSCSAIPVAAPSFTVGGTVNGLRGGTLVIANGSDTINVSADGNFTFRQPVISGATYNVVAQTSPIGQSCTVSNGAGIAASDNVSNVAVNCAVNAYTVGGSISGLSTSGLVLTNNGRDTLNVAANASIFTMGQPVPYGAPYSIAVQHQPDDFQCTLTNGSGTIGFMNVTDVAVRCAATIYQVSTFSGNGNGGFVDGSQSTAEFRSPRGVAFDSNGNLIVADSDNGRVRKIAPDGTVTTVAGNGSYGFADGPASSAQFAGPNATAIDRNGNIFVADPGNQRIRKIAFDGTVSTLAGTGVSGYADGPGATAQFNLPDGIAVDTVGNIYVADGGNNRIRKIAPDGTVSTFAGTGASGYLDGDRAIAQFNFPYGIAIDSIGTIYVGDNGNHRIRKIVSDGTVSTLAGSSQGYADGSSATAKFAYPQGVAVDANGNVFVADVANYRIRKISADGTVSTRAGSGSRGFADGNASTAQFNNAKAVAVDANGNVFVADNDNRRIRKIAP